MEIDDIEADSFNEAINDAILDEQDQSLNAGGFFTVNLMQIDSMVANDATCDDVLAYLVLNKGINDRNDIYITSYGAQVIHKRTGMTYTRAEQAIKWLLTNGYIAKAEGDNIPAQLGKGTSLKHKSRWIVNQVSDSKSTALANALIDGIGRGKNKPPLMRIYHETKLGEHCIISDSILDSIVLLLHLYWNHHFADCGGINPRTCLYRNWQIAENIDGIKIADIEDTNAALYEIKGDIETLFTAFADAALFYIEDNTERYERFWEAFTNLKSMGLLYEVTQIWDSNPNGKNGRKAKPLYTLYIHDRHARNSEPYLQRQIHTLAFKTETLDRYQEFVSGLDFGESNLQSGQFRYIATKKMAGYPIGIYRLKFRPHTPDTGIGIEGERRRVKNWSESLESIANNLR